MLKNVILFTVLKSSNNKYVPLKKILERERENTTMKTKQKKIIRISIKKKRQIANSFKIYPLFNHI